MIFLDFIPKIPRNFGILNYKSLNFAPQHQGISMIIKRTLEDKITALLGSKKAIIIMGARQTGKTTLLRSVLAKRNDTIWMNGDDVDVQQLFSQITSSRIKALIGNKRIVIVDEAQRIKDIGLRLKLITDQVDGVQVVATGSSSFELANKVNEPLTGRKREFKLFPLTFAETAAHHSLLEELRLIPHRMTYGYYPEVVCSPGEEAVVLKELFDSYLYRDILSLDGIGKPDKVSLLLQALAYQVGSQVRYNEIGQLIGLDPKTVERYVDILEKSYIIFRLGSFRRNLRNELKASRKIYFWDLGIRNAAIGNFAQIENRTDAGALWENFCIAERMKRLSYQGSFAHSWFWRTLQQREIDYIEEENGKVSAFEFKWNSKKAATKIPEAFATAYPDATFRVVTPQNIEEFIM